MELNSREVQTFVGRDAVCVCVMGGGEERKIGNVWRVGRCERETKSVVCVVC